MTKPVALTIAGSDSGGGAGIQADLKTMEAHGVFGTSVLAALTAQNTQSVTMSYDVPDQMVAAQIDAVAQDFELSAVKTGMLSSASIIETIVERLQAHGLAGEGSPPLVVDPVMISKSGFTLLKDDAIGALTNELLPLATVVTPNVHEAEHLTGIDIRNLDDAKEAAEAIHAFGPKAVIVKGGHLRDDPEAVDVLFDGTAFHRFVAPRVRTENTHGTGCTFASAIAANLALGHSLPESVDRAKQYLTSALRNALDIGHGYGPTNHFFHLDATTALSKTDSTAV